MRCPLEKMHKRVFQAVKVIGRRADQEGLKAFLVGGIVRDLFLGRENRDIDVVVEGDAVGFAERIAAQRGLSVKTHKRFGTATIGGWNNLHVDIVTARSEHYPYPGALPVVRKGILKDDIFRRDFTLNALAVCINRDGFGRLVDLCGGRQDLRKGLVRVFHDRSFFDDPTRILRAVRFEQRFGFRMAPKTLRLLKQAVADRADQTVSPPRYFQEFARGLAGDTAGKYIRRLWSLGALDFLELPGRCPASELLRLDQMRWQDPVQQRLAYLDVLYRDISQQDLLKYGARFQWPRLDKKRLIAMRDQE